MRFNFTLIVPTHNRHSYLKRSIDYYKNLEADVIYCDSSEHRFDGFIGENMEYLYLRGKKFHEKIIIALKYAKTSYIALCADDDFILIPSLYKGIQFLDNNQEYKTLVGKYVSFNDTFDGNFYRKYQKLPQDLNLGCEANAKLFFENYFQILWAMYDKNVLIESFKVIKKAKYGNDNFIELTIGAVVCKLGGIKFLNRIWGVREISTKEHWANQHARIDNIYFNKDVEKDFNLFKFYIDEITFDGYADLVLKNYLRFCNRKNRKKKYLKAVLIRFTPQKIWATFKKYFVKLSLIKDYKNNLSVVTSPDEQLDLNVVKTILHKDVKDN